MGWAGDRKVTWKTVVSRRLNTKLLQAEKPDVYEQYLTESSYRRFTIK